MSARVRRLSGAVLLWSGAALYPGVLFLVLSSGWLVSPEVDILLCAASTVLVAVLLRRHPLPAHAILLFAWILALAETENGAVAGGEILLTDLAVCYIAATRRRRVSGSVAVVTGVLQLLSVTAFLMPDEVLLLTIVLAMVVVWMTGNSIRVRRAHAEEMRERETAQAVAAERLRIARELHDMVAHSIGIIAIQAGVGGRVIETQPAEARNALGAIEATSRDTLSGLRRMLTALRADDPAPLGPAPGLADLDGLAAATADAGVEVDIRRTGEPRALPPDVDLSAYRIVQEAVTNVVRHAGTDQCRVTIDYREGELAIEVADEGRGGVVGAGYGLVGMRERVALLRGEFAAGPCPAGGFRVAARIPAPAAA
ncbi:sensor histidine kinase [Actinomadura sp. NAK00032]|uniref:sensor histidine kinase n=1 Tax=Actinomadura sp. NAK00032 TaxID=2742128 RepID=UPI001591CF09|nr:sensor histidine kinase [Actinomadura sp. NAK00032]QKW33691.1 sensor histidine kinase [Actinomadura sp. NAK00032]